MIGALAALGACVAPLPDDTPIVTGPRLLSARAVPAEAAPGEVVSLEVLAWDGAGPVDDPPVDWGFCTAIKPLAELGPVAPSCLAGDDQEPLGVGPSVEGAVPADACSLFGPNPPPPAEGEPAGRPADPDVTGGYYQPVVADWGEEQLLASVRIRCGLANVSQEDYVAWNQGYLSNVAPTPTLWINGAAVADGDAVAVPRGPVSVSVAWPDCDTSCGGAESYLLWDPVQTALTTRREAISATWFATDGSWEVARSGVAGSDRTHVLDNTWTFGDDTDVWLGVVLRDERGGVGWSQVQLAP